MLAIAVAKHLAAEVSVETLTYATNLFHDYMPDSPDLCVAIMTQPGLPQGSTVPSDLPGIQALVRGPAGAGGTRRAYNLARDIYGQLTCMDRVKLDEGGDDEVLVIGCTADQSEPTPIGRDENERPEFSLNFQARTHAPTRYRP